MSEPMRNSVRYAFDGDVVVVNGVGAYGLDQYLNTLDSAFSDPRCPEVAGLLADATESELVRSSAEMRRVAAHLCGLAPRLQCVAVVAPNPAQFGMTRVASAFVGDSGPTTEAFHSATEAREWLSERLASGRGA